MAVSRGARRKREEVQLRREDPQQKRPRPAPVMGGARKRKGDDKDGKAVSVAPEPRIRQAPPQAPAAVAAIEDTRETRDTPATRTSANARGADHTSSRNRDGKIRTMIKHFGWP